LRIGDLVSIRSKHGVALVHYVCRDAFYGHAIYVYSVWHKTLQQALRTPLPNGYLTFYPAQSATLQGLAKIVASAPLPKGIQLPIRHRRAGASNRQGDVLAWFIVAADGVERMKRRLTDADRQLPIAAIWGHQYLKDRITERWRPEQEE
jgi:hypothetical protein